MTEPTIVLPDPFDGAPYSGPKYGHVRVESGDIPEDEPVVIFRAKDRNLPAVLQHYGDLCHEAGSPIEHIAAIESLTTRVQLWQRANDTQIPD